MTTVTQDTTEINTVELRSRSQVGRTYTMRAVPAEYRLRHTYGDECIARRRGLDCWHEAEATYITVMLAPMRERQCRALTLAALVEEMGGRPARDYWQRIHAERDAARRMIGVAS